MTTPSWTLASSPMYRGCPSSPRTAAKGETITFFPRVTFPMTAARGCTYAVGSMTGSDTLPLKSVFTFFSIIPFPSSPLLIFRLLGTGRYAALPSRFSRSVSVSCRQISSIWASVSSKVPSLLMTKSARGTFSSMGIWEASRRAASSRV